MSEAELTDALRAMIGTFGAAKVVLTAADVCHETFEREGGKPVGIIASINANLLRLAVSRMIA